MKRDFTTGVRDQLKELVEDKYEIDWSVSNAEYVDDLLNTDVREDWTTLENQVSAIRANNSLSVTKINEIWNKIAELDTAYVAKLTSLNDLAEAYYKKLKMIREKIRPEAIIGSLQGDPQMLKDEFLAVTERIETRKVAIEFEKLIVRNADGEIVDYKWEEIHALMQKNQDKVTDIQYLALIRMIDSMKIEDLGKFIENSYLDNPENVVVKGTSLLDVNWIYELSPVFIKLSGEYYAEIEVLLNFKEFSNTDLALADENLTDALTKQGILLGICQNASRIYRFGHGLPIEGNGGGGIDVKLEKGMTKQNGISYYNIEFDGGYTEIFDSFSAEKGIRQCEIKVFPYHSELQTLLTTIIADGVDSMKRDKDEELLKYGMDKITGEIFGMAVSGKIDKIFEGATGGVGAMIKGYNIVVDIGEINNEISSLVNDIDIHNRNIDQIIQNLNTANATECLMCGAQVTVNHDGTFQYNSIAFDKDNLDFALNIYERETGKNLASEEIIEGISSDGFVFSDEWKAYREWYNGDEKGTAIIEKARKDLQD